MKLHTNILFRLGKRSISGAADLMAASLRQSGGKLKITSSLPNLTSSQFVEAPCRTPFGRERRYRRKSVGPFSCSLITYSTIPLLYLFVRLCTCTFCISRLFIISYLRPVPDAPSTTYDLNRATTFLHPLLALLCRSAAGPS
jgi:hypothetical protein